MSATREALEITETYKTAIDKYGLISALERLDYAENEINLFYIDGLEAHLAVALRQADIAWKRLGPVVWESMPTKPSEIYEKKKAGELPTKAELAGDPAFARYGSKKLQRVMEGLVASIVEESIDEAHEQIISTLQAKNLYLKQTRMFSKKNFPNVNKGNWGSKVSDLNKPQEAAAVAGPSPAQ